MQCSLIHTYMIVDSGNEIHDFQYILEFGKLHEKEEEEEEELIFSVFVDSWEILNEK